MSRLSNLGVSLAAATLLWSPILVQPILAQTTAPSSARIQNVVVHGTDAAMEVEIHTTGAQVAPNAQSITGPDRIIIDFPGALPAAELRALNVSRGALKGVRAGLFFNNPPITRIVLDLAEPQTYQISTIKNATVIKLSAGKLGLGKRDSDTSTASHVPVVSPAHPAKLQNVALASGTKIAGARITAAVSNAVANTAPQPPAPVEVAA